MIQDKKYLDNLQQKENSKKATRANNLALIAIIISALSLLVSIIQTLR